MTSITLAWSAVIYLRLLLMRELDNATFRLLKANTPGPYTFILNATKEVPKRFFRP